ncbi:MAG TPA: DRTGG domain-containing protein [Thermodesulfovibrio thiophilus]|uniref:DRTGG domain-containing protein n=1 Tax=Thermodesulfovibrio thiophilus TaxID=340095 RepID=UPI00185AC159|nr:DRTGG domain-containing protein [Thermodesulfovibrio thiophilus]HHW20068.1 phosphotransacetylase family protein [Thermodesulfovibrio thiophilus]HOA83339.1 DRTGG domain-containing protein [Thermodesulfovibrio thiophilus]HQA04072.1 DRTGG domain-containing protein [Thermodesulfovibrio thiophilus]HQD36011.1 DRTGG domain-containing protein [Thermodesulfovibrio thiophilus]
MIPIFIISNRAFTGKNFFALGLALTLKERGFKVGYIRPLGRIPLKKGDEVFDEEAVFIKELLGLEEPLNVISPFVFTYETQYRLFEGSDLKVKEKVLNSFSKQSNKDFVIVVGSNNIFEGFTLGIDAIGLLNETNGKVIAIQHWDSDIAMDDIFGIRQLVGDRFIGAVINKIVPEQFHHVKEKVVPFIEGKGIKILGVFKKDKFLEAVTVRRLMEAVNGGLVCCEDKLDEFVENLSIGAMDPETALSYFLRTPNKAVITGIHRTDIQIVAMETSTKCLILTGGMHVNETVSGIAKAKGIPIVVTPMDTFAAVDRMEKLMGKAVIREKDKAIKAKEVVSSEFDIEEFLRKIR